MKITALAALLALTLSVSGSALAQAPAPADADTVATANGALTIRPIAHASFVMTWNGRAVYVDPVGDPALYKGLPHPDLILITDVHPDHMQASTLEALVGKGATIIAPPAVRDILPISLKTWIAPLANGQTTTIGEFGLQAVAMYNTTPDRLQFHPKGRGNGYVLSLGGKRIYIAGDTEPTPEMLGLKAIDVAFLPMNLPYTMTPAQAAEAVKSFKPKIVYPYHFGGSDPNAFAALVGPDTGVEVRLRRWY